jgi:hypothetical protein
MVQRKQWWPSQGSLFAAVLDTALALWGFVLALGHRTRVEFWVMGGFFGALAIWEWYAYLHKDNGQAGGSGSSKAPCQRQG